MLEDTVETGKIIQDTQTNFKVASLFKARDIVSRSNSRIEGIAVEKGMQEGKERSKIKQKRPPLKG